jgi:hypothetical protein
MILVALREITVLTKGRVGAMKGAAVMAAFERGDHGF